MHMCNTAGADQEVADPPRVYGANASNKRFRSAGEGSTRASKRAATSRAHIQRLSKQNAGRGLSDPNLKRQKGRPQGAPSQCSWCKQVGHNRGGKCPEFQNAWSQPKDRQRIQATQTVQAHRKAPIPILHHGRHHHHSTVHPPTSPTAPASTMSWTAMGGRGVAPYEQKSRQRQPCHAHATERHQHARDNKRPCHVGHDMHSRRHQGSSRLRGPLVH